MDTLTFVSKLVDALAWPAAAVILVTLLRNEISSLLPHMKSFKAGPLEAEFEKEVRELRSSVEASSAVTGDAIVIASSTVSKLAELSPRSAILEAWREIETTGRRLLQERQPQLSEADVRSTREVIRLLGQTELLASDEVAVLQEMRFLRNQAVHSDAFNPTQDAALNFAQTAALILQRMRRKKNP